MKHILYSVSERSANRLTLHRNRSRFLYQFVFLSLFLVGWFAGLLQVNENAKNLHDKFMYLIENPFYWIFWASAIWIAYGIPKNLYLFLNGDKLFIDKGDRTISKNGNTIVRFDDCECLQIRKYSDSDGDTDYRLSIVKKDGAKVFIDRASDKDGIQEFAEEIADFIDVPIVVK